MISAVILGLSDSSYDIIRLEISVVISDPALGWLHSSLRKLNVIKFVNSLNITFGVRPEYIYEFLVKLYCHGKACAKKVHLFWCLSSVGLASPAAVCLVLTEKLMTIHL